MNFARKVAADVLKGGMSVSERYAAKDELLLVMPILLPRAVEMGILQFSVALAGRIQPFIKLITGIGLCGA